MLGITDYLWRLIPGNPILRRVVETGGKKRRDMFIRCGYLGLLVTVVIYKLLTTNTGYASAGLAELAKASAELFQQMSYMQLGLVALLAPIFTAGAITQEKDSQTYDILLSTPLTNGQIILGSLLSRLFFVIALLVSGIPIFAITQIFGGVAIRSIVYSFLIAAATAYVTGAMAMAIATFKIGTRRTIFSFYLFIVIYLVGIYLLDSVPMFQIPGRNDGSNISWFTGLHPFLALHVILNDRMYVPPDLASLPENLRAWPIGWYLTSPETFYITFMFVLGTVMILPSVVLLRRMAQSTTSLKSWALQLLRLKKGDRTRKPRTVWNNPIAWREAKTKASAARATFLRFGFIAAGLLGALTLVVMHSTEGVASQYVNLGGYDPTRQTLFIQGDNPRDLSISSTAKLKINGEDSDLSVLNGTYQVKGFTQGGPHGAIDSVDLVDFPRELNSDDARTWLLGATIVELAVILLIVSNAAASTVTREKEDGTLDLLLTSPITSRYYIWGKLRGLVSFVLPLVAVPVISCLLFIVHDGFRWLFERDMDFHWIVAPEAIFLMPGMLIIVVAFASILGMQLSLRCKTTVRAVMASVGIMVGACTVMGFCGKQLLEGRGSDYFGVGLGAFSPFTLMTLLIDPYKYGGSLFDPLSGDADPATARVIITIFTVCAVSGYAFVVWSMYKSMVKNFDMTIRRQSR